MINNLVLYSVRRLSVGASAILVSIGLLLAASSAKALTPEDLMFNVNPPLIDPMNLAYTSELSLNGWSAVASDGDGSRLQTGEIIVHIKFDRGGADEVVGTPVKVKMFENTRNKDSDEIFGRGFLKDGNLKVYQSDSEESTPGRLLIEANDIKNLADFEATVYISPEDKGKVFNFIDFLTWFKTLAKTPTSIYTGPQGAEVMIQMIRPFGKNNQGIKALVFCISISGSGLFGERGNNNWWVLTVMNSNDKILFDPDQMPYLGLAKWCDDKLLVIRDGRSYEMHLKERSISYNAEILVGIAEMEGWDSFDIPFE